MNKGLVVLFATAVSLGAGRASGPGERGTRQSTGGAPINSPPAVADSTTLSARGTIAAFDEATRTLSLTTSSGTLKFPLALTTRIRQGWHKVEASELGKHAGDRATVRYTELSGSKVVESVHVFGK